MPKIKITQVFKVTANITVDVPESEVSKYLEGDFETPSSDTKDWEYQWDLQNEETIQVPTLMPGQPGFSWPACSQCGSRSFRCGCD